jgi:hypothetical protein
MSSSLERSDTFLFDALILAALGHPARWNFFVFVLMIYEVSDGTCPDVPDSALPAVFPETAVLPPASPAPSASPDLHVSDGDIFHFIDLPSVSATIVPCSSVRIP